MAFNPKSWMSQLPSSTPLTALSIPGTHNSPCYFHALPSVRCQAVSIAQQLSNGIRFLDIRVQPSTNPDNDKLILVHGAFPISLNGRKAFRSCVLGPVKEFLKECPSETVILSVKREGTGKGTDESLSEILFRHYVVKEEGLWWADESIPSLGEARGKIVLLRRFKVHDEGVWGIDGEYWAYIFSSMAWNAVSSNDELAITRPMPPPVQSASKTSANSVSRLILTQRYPTP